MGYSVINFFIAIICAPIMFGIINKTKAKFGGRKGAPVLQAYYDIFKLLKKGAVYSKTTTWIFKLAPSLGLACVFVALTLLPLHGNKALLHFSGDMFLFIYVLALMVFFTVLAALDTGSAFEGMGGSREVLFSFLAEPALVVGLCVFARTTGYISLSKILPSTLITQPELLLVVVALFIVFLCENARIPVDDPNTHLELTMIHEVMVLDHSGPDFAFIIYSSSLKMWAFAMIIIQLLLPLHNPNAWLHNTVYSIVGIIVFSIIVGIVESVMARLRLTSVPKLIIIANSLSILAFILVGN